MVKKNGEYFLHLFGGDWKTSYLLAQGARPFLHSPPSTYTHGYIPTLNLYYTAWSPAFWYIRKGHHHPRCWEPAGGTRPYGYNLSWEAQNVATLRGQSDQHHLPASFHYHRYHHHSVGTQDRPKLWKAWLRIGLYYYDIYGSLIWGKH